MPFIINYLNNNFKSIFEKSFKPCQTTYFCLKSTFVVLITTLFTVFLYQILVNRIFPEHRKFRENIYNSNQLAPLRHFDIGRILCKKVGNEESFKHHQKNDYSDKNHSETLASMKLARDMVNQGRADKALKIYLHALALDPHNSQLLNSYGEFLETYKKDIVNAEHHYCKAVISNPSYGKALQNHKRTLPLVEEIDRNRFDALDNKLRVLLTVPPNHPGLRRHTSEQYYRHIYHTTAMEGNTFTLSQTRSFVENRIVISGKSIMEHNEILGMEAALQFLNTSFEFKRLGNIKIRHILEIHRRVMGYVDPFGGGVLRSTQVFVGNHVPPPPEQIPSLMEEFEEWLNDPYTISDLHPIEMGALAHYKLVYVHPFYDGNGRTSRLLMNLILMMAGYPAIIVPVDKKQFYYAHLETANKGDVRPFIRFMARCAEDVLDEYLLASIAYAHQKFPELADKLTSPRIEEGRTIIT